MISKSFYILAGSGLFSRAISLLTNLILARLISPSNFGKIALVMVVFSISNFIVSGGMSDAIIRFKISDNKSLNTIFTFNLFLGAILYTLVWISAKYVSGYFGVTDLVWIIRIMGLDILFKSFYVVRASRIKQKLRFDVIAKIQLINSFVILFVSVALAAFGFELVALSVKFMIGGLTSALLYAYYLEERYTLNFNLKPISAPIFYGLNVTMLGITNSFVRNIPVLRMSTWFSMDLIGFYSQAIILVEMGLGTLQTSIQNVLFPIIAERDEGRLSKHLAEFYQSFLFIFAPILAIFIGSVVYLVPVFYGNEWLRMAGLAKLLALTVPLRFLSGYLLVLIKVFSSGSVYMFQGFIKLILFSVPFYFLVLDTVQEVIILILFLELLVLILLAIITWKIWSDIDSYFLIFLGHIIVFYSSTAFIHIHTLSSNINWFIAILIWLTLLYSFRKKKYKQIR